MYERVKCGDCGEKIPPGAPCWYCQVVARRQDEQAECSGREPVERPAEVRLDVLAEQARAAPTLGQGAMGLGMTPGSLATVKTLMAMHFYASRVLGQMSPLRPSERKRLANEAVLDAEELLRRLSQE